VVIPGPDRRHWLGVDSLRCQDVNGDLNPTLTVLSAQNTRLDAVVLTHPHRDHVRGFVQLLDWRAPGSPVGCLPAHLETDQTWRSSDDAGRVVDGNAGSAALNRIDEIWRTEPSSRWELTAEETRMIGDARLEVLHPLAVPDRKPTDLNRLSSPLLVEWEHCRILLGADLSRSGWKKVGKHYPRADELAGAHALKASHHGSANSQDPLVIGVPPPGDRFCVLTPFNRGKALPDYGNGGGVDQILRSHRRIAVTAAPPEARGKEEPRARLAPSHTSFGEFSLVYEPSPAPPLDGWVAVAFDASGTEVQQCQGDAAGVVV
jgi:hypothetical protein